MGRRKLTAENLPEGRMLLDDPETGREAMRLLIEEKNVNVKGLFAPGYEPLRPRPEGLTYLNITNALASPSQRTADAAEWNWLLNELQNNENLPRFGLEKKGYIGSNYNHLMTEMPRLYEMAEDGAFPPRPFTAHGGVVMGSMMPAGLLAAWFRANPGVRKETEVVFQGSRDAYNFYTKPLAPAPGEKSARIIAVGRQKEELRLLAVASPALCDSVGAFALPSEMAPVAENPPPSLNVFPVQDIMNFHRVPDIADVCTQKKAVLLKEIAGLAAVSVETGKALAEKIAPGAGQEIITPISSTDVNHTTFDIPGAQAGRCFPLVTRGKKGRFGKNFSQEELFMIVPARLLLWLDFMPDGTIKGVKDDKGLSFRFNVSAKIMVGGALADVYIEPDRKTDLRALGIVFARAQRGESSSSGCERHSLRKADGVFSGVLNLDGSVTDIALDFGSGNTNWPAIAMNLAQRATLHFGFRELDIQPQATCLASPLETASPFPSPRNAGG